MTEQATVSTYNDDGSATLLTDQGLLLDASPASVSTGHWRHLRPGQRVTLRRDPRGVVTAVLRPA